MNEESTRLFKVFRVLVFPMSLNAVGLGALASLAFFLLTWAVCLVTNIDIPVGVVAERFFSTALQCITTGSWPRGDYGWIFGFQLASFFAIWATFGVAICRILALRIARDEICSVKDAWCYAWRVKITALLFPVALVLPILFLSLCNGVAGWVCSIPYLGWVLGVGLIPLVILSSLLIAVGIGVGLVSMGFIPAIIAIERKGTFDAAGKATNCITARPLAMILYLILMYLFIVGIVHGLLIQDGVVERIRDLTLVPFGDTDYLKIAAGDTDATTGFANFMAWIHKGIFKVFHALLWGLVISLTLGGFTSMFLILRKDVDGIDPADIARDPADVASEPTAEPADEAAAPEPEAESDSNDSSPPEPEQV